MNAKIKRLFVFIATLTLALVTILPTRLVYAAEPDTITILHTNDVHCAIDEYDKVAAYKKSFTNPVVLVDAGDHAQGELIGTITAGQKVVEIMNKAGYDLAVPGNHEFDYQVPAFLAMVASADYPYLSANFTKADGSKIDGIEPYTIMVVGGHTIGFVGISTPETYTKSTPVYFQDENGNWVYSFNENNLAEKVQAAVDAAKAAGAELVIAVAHTGIDGTDERWTSTAIIAATNGIDLYIDGHSHEVAENKSYPNKDGKQVPYQQTGTKLANIGQIDITFGETVEFNLHLVKVESLTEEDEEVKAMIEAANAEVDEYYNQVIGHSDFDLTIKNAEGTREVRKGETNLGDFNADAYRILGGADITLMNGGGVRADVPAGDITRKALTSVNPWMNAVCKVEVKGSVILDALEHGARNYPNENGGFFQVSGLTYKIDPTVETSVITDDQGMFVKVDGDRRVYDVMVAGEPIDPDKTYTVITTEYILLESGDGMAMFNGNVTVIEQYDDPDSEFLVRYLQEYLNGEVPEEYKDIAGQGRIVIEAKEAAKDTITILHTNDIHCAIDEYDKVAAYKQSITNPVVLVDAGDHAQGELIGTLTDGQKIVEIMNASGYDLAVPGNHEFDYQVPAFLAMVQAANYPYLSANFTKADGSKIDGIEPYKILTIGEHKIAFVGISTPETYTKSTPVYFQDGNGNWVYSFNENSLMEKVQAAVDAARAEGAELVIAVAHTGIDGTDERWTSTAIIAGTTGIDVYIDGHSHEALENKTFKNKDGEDVHYQQTGTKLANIGQIDITFGEKVEFELHLVKVEELTEEDPEVKAIIEAANAEVDEYYNQVIGHTDFPLTIQNAEGKREVRKGETNMGDFNADAYRIIGGADITLMNGGGVRADVGPGDITRKALTSVNPWMNAVVKVEVKGSVILDALEHGARNYPNENGGFFQVSGISYKIDPTVETSVVTDDQGMFVKVDGERRVYDVMVGEEPLDPEKTYTVITTEYILLESGDGMTMFNGNVTVIEEYDDPDSEFLVKYLVDYLHGEVPEEYRDIAGQGRIVFEEKPAVTYNVVTGADTTIIKGGEEDLEIVVKRSVEDNKTFGLFDRIEVNGEELAAENYTAEAGSLKALISADYLKTLDKGEYEVKVVFEDGEATTTFILADTPATGDRSQLGLYTLLLGVSLAATVYVLRRKEEE